MIEKVRHNK